MTHSRQIFYLDDAPPQTACKSIRARNCWPRTESQLLACFTVFMLRPEVSLVKLAARHVRALRESKDDKRFALVFVPKPSGQLNHSLLIAQFNRVGGSAVLESD